MNIHFQTLSFYPSRVFGHSMEEKREQTNYKGDSSNSLFKWTPCNLIQHCMTNGCILFAVLRTVYTYVCPTECQAYTLTHPLMFAIQPSIRLFCCNRLRIYAVRLKLLPQYVLFNQSDALVGWPMVPQATALLYFQKPIFFFSSKQHFEWYFISFWFESIILHRVHDVREFQVSHFKSSAICRNDIQFIEQQESRAASISFLIKRHDVQWM